MGMTGARALAVLESFVAGRPPDATPEELLELTKSDLVVEVDANAVRWSADLQDLATRHTFVTPEEESTLQRLPGKPEDEAAQRMELTLRRGRDALEQLREKLRSDAHRMMTPDGQLRQEESDVVRLRGLLGALSDPASAALLTKATDARAGIVGALQKGPVPGVLFGLSPSGSRAAGAIRARWARYANEPLAAFLKKFRKADRAIEALTEQVEYLARHLPPILAEKARPGVVTGLLKTGLPPKEAIRTYQEALGKTQMGQASERPGLALAVVRNRGAGEPLESVAGRLKAAKKLLARRAFDGPALRGAAKSLLPFGNQEAAADRFLAFCNQLSVQQVAANGDKQLKLAARLMPVSGEPHEVVRRCRHAADLLQKELPGGLADLAPVAVSLGALAPQLAAVPAVVKRFADLHRLLVQERAFSGPPPASVADLLASPGTPEEIVDVLKSVLRSLDGGKSPAHFGDSAHWDIACGLAKRYAY